MRKVVVIGDIGWAVGQIHRDVAKYLSYKYEFVFFDSSNCVIQDVITAVKNADHCITTFNLHQGLLQVFTDPVDLQKMMIVCHGYGEVTHALQRDPNSHLIQEFGLDYNNPSKILFANNAVYPPIQNVCPYMTFAVASDVLLPFFANIPKVFVTPNGIDPSNYTYTKRSGEIKLIGWCGANKGFKRQDVGLSIARAAKLPISFATSLSTSEVREWYTTIDILVMTAGPGEYDETGPLPPFEAVASGCVVLGFPVGNFRKIPGPKCYSVQDIVNAIQELQKDPKKYQDLAAQQYEFVTTQWSMQTLVQEWDKALEAHRK